MLFSGVLPEAKPDFPKCLYLDQNHWIALSRARLGIGEERLKPVVAALERAVASGRLIVPLSNIHILETAAPSGASRRRRLAETMVSLAGNWAIRPYHVLQVDEIRAAVAATLGLVRHPIPAVRRHAVARGILQALDAVAFEGQQAEEAEAHTLSAKFTIELLSGEPAHGPATASLRSQEEEDAARQTRARDEAIAALNRDERLQLDVRALIASPGVIRDIGAALRQLRCPLSAMNPHLTSYSQHLAFLRRVPTADVFLTLGQERFQDRNRKTHRNDFKDIGFLRVAIPYANIVVAERYWASVCNRNGLAEAYRTSVIDDLIHLPALLQAHGCSGDSDSLGSSRS
ncbi:MAG: hypothetical protein JNK48_17945 [Bryobacterales bacterium]|nr:hypothetical protein [Bryobacterales bacterium]